ncbi:MAG: formylglycine-generating enzyme family protein [Anaerolineae bacterium]|nr:formylglycine-generating enzyme family protein [Anaerolineae bacterium]
MHPDLKLDFVLIPAGDFLIGTDRKKDRLHQTDELPQHRLVITDFYLMRHPVTNVQYRLFMEITGHRPPLFWPDGQFPADLAEHPVVGVSFSDATAFCRWTATVTGLLVRLPTEAEWEKAARGPDGRLYPWGNEWRAGACNNRESKLGQTSPVGQFSPQGDSPYGVSDLAGNVQEWCASLFGPYPYDPRDGREVLVDEPEAESLLPQLHESGGISDPQRLEASWGKQTLRGGSWRESRTQSRCAYRSWAAPMHRSVDTGFRCCYEPR